MSEGDFHRTFVGDWLRAAAPAPSVTLLVRLFERGFAAMWNRAHTTLGDVTLTAIVERVLQDATERHPLLSGLAVDPTGLRIDLLRERAHELAPAELAGAIETVLSEFLIVLGSLTAEILTPALHGALAGVVLEEPMT